MNATLLNRISLVLAFAGLYVAGVLSLGHLLNVQIPCGITQGCDAVANHPSSKWFGVPVAYLGFLTYAVLAGLAAVRSAKGMAEARLLVLAGLAVSAAGALVSLGLTYYSITVIGATCSWCLTSAGIILALTIVHGLLANADLSKSQPNNFDPKMLAVLGLGTLIALGVQGNQLEAKGSKVAVSTDTLRNMPLEELAPSDSHGIGPEDAPITVIEFADLTCHHCLLMYPRVKALVESSKGKVRVIFRHFPLYDNVENRVTLPAALASEYAAENGKFWQFLDAIYGVEQPLQGPEGVLDMVTSLNLDPEKLKTRSRNGEDPIVKRVQRDRSVADKLGLQGTPTFIILTKEHGREIANNNTFFRILEQDRYKQILGNG